MSTASSDEHYIGIDVGTGSARASIIRRDGHLLASSTQEITTYRDEHDHRIFEQSTTNIWEAIVKVVRDVVRQSNVPNSSVKGIGVDATCSLAVTDLHGNPVVVTKGDTLGQNGARSIILWADHRAEEEANLINSSGSIVLDYVGGTMSLEMEIPKILWLKKNMPPDFFSRCQFFDLPDFLTYRMTSSTKRSICSLTCKCSFVPDKGWQASFFSDIGLKEFVDNDYVQIGASGKTDEMGTATAGMPVGKGLTAEAAEELGLEVGTPVGSGVIDAYAGWLGTVGARFKSPDGSLSSLPTLNDSKHRLAAVAGTSTCHLVQSPEGVFVKGVWGPYKSAVFPGWWMNEGGQSSTGQLIDFMITTHAAYPKLVERAEKEKTSIHTVLANILDHLKEEAKADSLTELTKDVHLYPDLHGNRSPIADPRMRGSIVGLTLDAGLNDLARKFSLTLESIALQTRHIVDSLNAAGHSVNSLYMSGGQAKNIPLMQLFADTTGMEVVLPFSSSDAVTRGSAILGRFAAEVGGKGALGGDEDIGEKLWNIMVEMTPNGTLVSPSASAKEKKLLEAKYKIFRESIEIQKRWREEMEAASK